MTPAEYHQVLIGLDRALFIFHEAKDSLTQQDQMLHFRIAKVRSDVLRAESGHPFPALSFQSSSAGEDIAGSDRIDEPAPPGTAAKTGRRSRDS